MSCRPILAVDKLELRAEAQSGDYSVVHDVSFEIRERELVALVGESGCGKSLTALAIIQLLPRGVRKGSGSVRFKGEDVLAAPISTVIALRGREIGFIFQDPMTSLNPVMTIGRQIGELLELEGMSRRDARREATRLLDLVRIDHAESRLGDYPHQFSGGMRQRVMIAMALSRRPSLLIADEPTTALDATVQAEVLDVLRELQRDLGMSVLLISHDLGMVGGLADRVVVMYAGYIVEQGPTAEMISSPLHPYTRGLLRCIPHVSRPAGRLSTIDGAPPDPWAMPPGCPFWPRCDLRADIRCESTLPPLRQTGLGHTVRSFCEVDAGD